MDGKTPRVIFAYDFRDKRYDGKVPKYGTLISPTDFTKT